ncbi:hypothetical protein C8A01DRAFT_34868 [Parachaetomium inaequale]|uniref:Uncharacterized protein n=1 Tax=Parachaetomium inaequale TaxID=2588326 RepID=A0AAN6ST42_9PEZI|nr:hypothetical protein C8A01DRAFT_34868 [Parachaetomium inaequale]
MSALERELAKSKMESQKSLDQDNRDWQRERWQQARRDMAADCFKTLPPARFPVILTPDGPVSLALHLQRLAESESLPETVETSQVDWNEVEVNKVTICHVSLEEKKRMKEKAEVLLGVKENIRVMFNGKTRYAMVVTGLKGGVTLGDTDEDDGSGEPGKLDE